MKRICLGIAVAVATFVLGIATSTVWSRSQWDTSKSSCSPAPSRDEEWHRLYEAAGMTGDAATIEEVSDRLLCANSAGISDAWPVEIEARAWCRKADGTIHELLVNDTSEYGSFSRRIKVSHSSWTLQNLDFVRSVSTAKRAKEYVSSQAWPRDR